MGQISLYAGKRKKTRREVFFDEVGLVVPWKALLGLIERLWARQRAERRGDGRARPRDSFA